MSDTFELPEGTRGRRRTDAERLETNAAIEAGQAFEEHAATLDGLVSTGELGDLPDGLVEDSESEEDRLARDVRLLFENRGDVKDSGSVDKAIVAELGFDVCAIPDLLFIIVDEAKGLYADTENQVRLEDILKTSKIIEAREMEARQTVAAEFVLAEHGIEEWEIREISTENPRQARSVAKLLESPILGPFSTRVKAQVFEEGRKYLFDEITARALAIMRRYSHHQAALQEGDPIAIELQRQIMKRREMQTALGEMLMREEFETDRVSKELPDPEEV